MKKNDIDSSDVFLKMTSSMGVGGKIAPVGSIVSVSDQDAKSFLGRRKAVLATAEDMEAYERAQEYEEAPERESDDAASGLESDKIPDGDAPQSSKPESKQPAGKSKK